MYRQPKIFCYRSKQVVVVSGREYPHSMNIVCPKCTSGRGLREIIYGLPAEPIDETKYAVGGCCISDKDPSLRCIECGWEGEYKNHMPFKDNIIRVAELKPLTDMNDVEIEAYAKELWGKLTNDGGSGKDGNPKS